MSKKLQLSICAFLISLQILAQDFPVLVDTLIAPCGDVFHYDHDPTGFTDPVGFQIVPEIPCLPTWIEIRHEAYVILDIIQTWVHGPNGWVKIQDSGWHDDLYKATVVIPDWADNIIFVSHNNTSAFTAWWLGLICHYVPLEECCTTDFVLHGPKMACPGDEVTVWADSVSGNAPFMYFWNTGDADSVTNKVISQTKVFTLTVKDRFGCPGTKSISVWVPDSPVNFSDTLVCPNVWVSVPENPNVTWQQDTLVFVKDDVTLWATTIDTFGCEHFVPFSIDVQNAPIVSSDTVVCRNRYITVEVNSGVEFSWSNTSGEVSDQKKFWPFVVQDTFFVLQVLDTLNCVWEDTVNVEAQYCLDDVAHFEPNVIMPVGASHPQNGYWQSFFDPDSFGEIEIVSLQIWDRWGSLAYEARGEMVWPGKYADGKDAPSGVYIWKINVETFEGNFTLTGDVTVVR